MALVVTVNVDGASDNWDLIAQPKPRFAARDDELFSRDSGKELDGKSEEQRLIAVHIAVHDIVDVFPTT